MEEKKQTSSIFYIKMVRSVFADTSIEKYLDNLIESDEFSYGIIIGQVMFNKKLFPQKKHRNENVMFTGDTTRKGHCYPFS